MKRWIIAALAVLAAVGLVTTATAAPAKQGEKSAKSAKAKKGAGAFNKALATKLGEQLDKPAEDVRKAMKAATKGRQKLDKPAAGTKPTAEQREARREAMAKQRDAWVASVAKALNVEPKAVTDAVRALVKQRLDSLVEDGWITAEQAAKRQDKLWIPFLRLR